MSNMISIIFGFFIIMGVIYSIFNGTYIDVSNSILKSASDTFKIITTMLPVMALWLGITNIAHQSGLLNKLSKLLKPVLNILFKNVDDETYEYISSNIVMNMFGLGNAATPMGIKAMEKLKKSDVATDDMITFLILNTVGFTIIPTTVISYRLLYGSVNPNLIIPLSLLSSFLSLVVGLILNKIIRGLYKWQS